MPRGVAVVTGASRGLGRELALALAREGYDLVVCARGRRELEAVRDEVAALGAACLVWEGDLSHAADLTPFVRTYPVTALVNNAAWAPGLQPLEECSADDYQRTFDLNVYVPLRLMRAVIPGMKHRGSGAIVNICSLSGRRAIRNASLYCASKFALRGLTEALGQELEGTGVRCFSVSPGGMNTPMREQVFHDAAQQQDPALVAQIVAQAIAGRIPVPQGGDLVVRHGQYVAVPREQWTGIVRGATPETAGRPV